MKPEYNENHLPQGPEATKAAFEKVIHIRGVYAKLKLPQNTVAQMRHHYKQGLVTIDRMHYVLKLAGYKIAQEELWVKEVKTFKADSTFWDKYTTNGKSK